jgi:hypothetical protein
MSTTSRVRANATSLDRQPAPPAGANGRKALQGLRAPAKAGATGRSAKALLVGKTDQVMNRFPLTSYDALTNFASQHWRGVRATLEQAHAGEVPKQVDTGMKTEPYPAKELWDALEAFKTTPAYTATAFKGNGVRLEAEFLEARGYYDGSSNLNNQKWGNKTIYRQVPGGAADNPVSVASEQVLHQAKSSRGYAATLKAATRSPEALAILLTQVGYKALEERPALSIGSNELAWARDLSDLIYHAAPKYRVLDDHSDLGPGPLVRMLRQIDPKDLPGLWERPKALLDRLLQIHNGERAPFKDPRSFTDDEHAVARDLLKLLSATDRLMGGTLKRDLPGAPPHDKRLEILFQAQNATGMLKGLLARNPKDEHIAAAAKAFSFGAGPLTS